jgi:hypothetical protein
MADNHKIDLLDIFVPDGKALPESVISKTLISPDVQAARTIKK